MSSYTDAALVRDLLALRALGGDAAVAAGDGVLSAEHEAMVVGIAALAALHRPTERLVERVAIVPRALSRHVRALTSRTFASVVRDRIFAFVGPVSSTTALLTLRVAHEQLCARQCRCLQSSDAAAHVPAERWTTAAAERAWSDAPRVSAAAIERVRVAFDGASDSAVWIAALRAAAGADGRLVLGSDAVVSLRERGVGSRKQDAKDIQRDSLRVNGAVISDGGVEYDEVVDRLVAHLAAVARETLGAAAAGGAAQPQLRPAALLREHAQQLLRLGNRTTSGGCAYDAIGLLLDHRAHIAPRGGDPIAFAVDVGPFCSRGSGGNSARGGSAWGIGLRCEVTATTRYELYNPNVEDMSDPSAAFATVDASFRAGLALHVLPNLLLRRDAGEQADAVVELRFEFRPEDEEMGAEEGKVV